jgi:hypothetical protein
MTEKDDTTICAPKSSTTVPADRRYELAPGGRKLYAFRYDPPTAWLLETGAGELQEQPLPDGCDTSTAIPAAPFWGNPPHGCSTTNAAAEASCSASGARATSRSCLLETCTHRSELI